MNNGTDILASVRNSVGALSVGLSDGLTQGADALSGISSAVGTDLGKLNEKVQNVNEKIGIYAGFNFKKRGNSDSS